MRWKFHTPGEVPQEDAQRASTSERIDRWWAEFGEHTDDLDRLFNNQAEWNLVDWMQQHLQSIDPRLMWEFGAGDKQGHRLIVTPETQYHLRPLVDEILARAPDLPGWSFAPYRPAENIEHMRATVRSRTGLEPAFTGIAPAAGELNRVDLAFEFPPSFLQSERNIAQTQAFIATQSLLGEDLLNDWLGKLDALAQVAQPLPAGALPRAFTAVVAKQRSRLPPAPFLERLDSLSWTGIELQPKEARDYAHRFDLLSALTGAEALWRNAHSDQLFWSGRFSRCGETFCYVKIDRASHPQGSTVEERTQLEAQLNQALMPQRLGCAIGGGVGLRYTYIDLAVLDVRAAADVIRKVFQQSTLVSPRAWIQFFDHALAAEWIALAAASGAPPMPWD